MGKKGKSVVVGSFRTKWLNGFNECAELLRNAYKPYCDKKPELLEDNYKAFESKINEVRDRINAAEVKITKNSINSAITDENKLLMDMQDRIKAMREDMDSLINKIEADKVNNESFKEINKLNKDIYFRAFELFLECYEKITYTKALLDNNSQYKGTLDNDLPKILNLLIQQMNALGPLLNAFAWRNAENNLINAYNHGAEKEQIADLLRTVLVETVENKRVIPVITQYDNPSDYLKQLQKDVLIRGTKLVTLTNQYMKKASKANEERLRIQKEKAELKRTALASTTALDNSAVASIEAATTTTSTTTTAPTESSSSATTGVVNSVHDHDAASKDFGASATVPPESTASTTVSTSSSASQEATNSAEPPKKEEGRNRLWKCLGVGAVSVISIGVAVYMASNIQALKPVTSPIMKFGDVCKNLFLSIVQKAYSRPNK